MLNIPYRRQENVSYIIGILKKILQVPIAYSDYYVCLQNWFITFMN